MSLGIAIKGPEGLVLAAESRITLSAKNPQGADILVNFDNATKLFSFSEPNVFFGAVTYGVAAIGFRTAHSFIPEFEASLPKERMTIQDFSTKLSAFFLNQWQSGMPVNYQGPNMTFVVAGFNEAEPYGRIFVIDIPRKPTPIEQSPNPGEFGISWGGQREFVDRLIQGFDSRLPDKVAESLKLSSSQVQALKQALGGFQMQIPLNAMPLQDCVDLAMFFVKTTIIAQRLTVGIRGCGGSIDVAIITRRGGLQFIRQKQIKGEAD